MLYLRVLEDADACGNAGFPMMPRSMRPAHPDHPVPPDAATQMGLRHVIRYPVKTLRRSGRLDQAAQIDALLDRLRSRLAR